MKSANFVLALALVLVGCGAGEEAKVETEAETAAAPTMAESAAQKHAVMEELVAPARAPGVDGARLAAVLDAQSDELKARYPFRHPQETLTFFGISPGMTVVEVLPGRGWYSPILVAYLGTEGQLIGADYPLELWPNFSFATEEFIEKRRAWVDTWPQQAAEWGDGAAVQATRIGEFPADLAGTVDAVLFVRALHNLRRFEAQGGFLTTALADTMALLKPGGVVGVVQHSAPDERSDEWADGSRGYLKQSTVIALFEDAGFQFMEQSDINANAKDFPGEEDIVWRLPPSLNTSKDNPELRAEYEAIGESNRMTLLFRKPSA